MNKIWHISDTHGFHRQLEVPDNIDIVICSGDSTNDRSAVFNEEEFYQFMLWYSKLDIPHKIYVAGNHDAFIAKCNSLARKAMKDFGIIYLEDSEIVINDIKFYGTPWTPEFCGWYFMKDRGKMYKIWERVPEDIDVLITHGPPKGLLDVSIDRNNNYELCGDKSVHNYFDRWKNLKYYLCGHIHNTHMCINTGIREYKHFKIINSAAVEDGRFDKGIIYNGTIFEL